MSSEPIKQLLQKVEKQEKDIFEAMRKAQELPPPSVSELVGDMDDLDVHQHACGGSDGDCCWKGQSDCSEHDEDISKSSAGIRTDSLFVKGESLEQLLHRSMELVTEMGLPEELRLQIQQLRHTYI